MKDSEFTRPCPICDKPMHYKRKKDCNYAAKLAKICKSCANKKRAEEGNYNPKEEFICFTCKTPFMEWRSQIENPDTPFCSKSCWYNSGIKTLEGKRYGRLSVLTKERQNNTTFYQCICDCGNSTITTHSNLISGNCKSCGCLQKELLASRSTLPLDEVVVNQVYTYYKRNARLRNISWSLSKDEVHRLIFQACYYCGITGGNITKTYNKSRYLANNGIDRKDNTLPYTIDNVVPCCKRCNQAKNDMSFEEFRTWAVRLAAKLADIS